MTVLRGHGARRTRLPRLALLLTLGVGIALLGASCGGGGSSADRGTTTSVDLSMYTVHLGAFQFALGDYNKAGRVLTEKEITCFENGVGAAAVRACIDAAAVPFEDASHVLTASIDGLARDDTVRAPCRSALIVMRERVLTYAEFPRRIAAAFGSESVPTHEANRALTRLNSALDGVSTRCEFATS